MGYLYWYNNVILSDTLIMDWSPTSARDKHEDPLIKIHQKDEASAIQLDLFLA